MLCVCEGVCECVEAGGGRRRSRPGIQNQKQEPHTKLWEKDDFEALLKKGFKGKSPVPKLRKSADKSLSQP